MLFSFLAVLFLEVFGLLGFGDVCEGRWCGMFILYGYGMLLRFCEVGGLLIVVALVCCSVFSLGCASVGCKSSNVTCV